jgi:methionine-rich copper-binding protein CopC
MRRPYRIVNTNYIVKPQLGDDMIAFGEESTAVFGGKMLLAAVGLAAVLASSGALLSPASAHAKLDSSDPVNGAELTAAPTKVSLTFDEPVTEPVLSASDDVGTVVALGDATLSGSTVTASWPAGTGGGIFRVEWQVKSDDGDVVDGVILFSVAGPKATGNTTVPAPGGTTGASTGSGLPAWLWLFLLLVAVVAGIAVIVARRSRAAVPAVADEGAAVEVATAARADPSPAITEPAADPANVPVDPDS